MNNSNPQYPSLIDSPLASDFGDSITIFDGTGSVDGTAFENISAIWHRAHEQRLLIRVSTPNSESVKWLSHSSARVNLTGWESVAALMQRITMGEESGLTLSTIRLTQPPVITNVVTFHVSNGPQWIGEFTSDGHRLRSSRVTFDANNYQISLDCCDEKLYEEFVDKGGNFVITGVGEISRKDSTSFSTDDPDLQLALEALGWALTFAHGRWVGAPMALSAHTEEGAEWQEHLLPRTSQYGMSQNWFSRFQVKGLEQVYSGMLKLLQDPIWEQPIKVLLSWYTDSQTSAGTTAGHLIWGQTALELLGWTLLTQHSAKFSEGNFNKAPAAAKIAELIKEIGIDSAIPARYADLFGFVSTVLIEPNQYNGPNAIAQMRNAYVHPNHAHKMAHLTGSAEHEAVELALAYIELSILKILGVTEKVMSRPRSRRAGEVFDLPWLVSPVTGP